MNVSLQYIITTHKEAIHHEWASSDRVNNWIWSLETSARSSDRNHERKHFKIIEDIKYGIKTRKEQDAIKKANTFSPIFYYENFPTERKVERILQWLSRTILL